MAYIYLIAIINIHKSTHCNNEYISFSQYITSDQLYKHLVDDRASSQNNLIDR
jgi:hypothetical protein